MESDVVRQRTRVEDQTEKTEKTEKRERRSKERMSVREPVLETRHWHRKRTWMPLFDVCLGSSFALRGGRGEQGEISKNFPGDGKQISGRILNLIRGWWDDFSEGDSQGVGDSYFKIKVS